MTAYIAAALKNLLPRRLALPTSLISAAAPRSLPASRSRHEQGATGTQPIFFRSEGFAEDLFDSYPFTDLNRSHSIRC